MNNATVEIQGSAVPTPLMEMLNADAIQVGAQASYELCKQIYLYHPLGKKMVDKPISKAQSQRRVITVKRGPESALVEAFEASWKDIKADQLIAMCMRLGRIYGTGAIVYGAEGVATDAEIKLTDLHKMSLYFNVLDPLNTTGSLVLNQDPNAPDFQKSTNITAAGVAYRRERSVVFMNETPIYIAFTNSAFGYVGRSVYQRALFPLKSFVQSMITDDLVTTKAGLLVAKIKQAGSIVDGIMKAANTFKRNVLREGKTGNVINIGPDDAVETLNMQNADTAMTTARKNILENTAAAAEMPSQLLNNETFAEGFGEGTEDAKEVAEYIKRIREEMDPLYQFFDVIVMYRAWNEDFYKSVIQDQFPEDYGSKTYEQAFMEWRGCFSATWPNLLEEPDSEKAKAEDVKLKALISVLEIFLNRLDPDNAKIMLQWFCDNLNENEVMFPHSLDLDAEALANFIQEQRERMESMGDSGSEIDKEEQPNAKAPMSYVKAA